MEVWPFQIKMIPKPQEACISLQYLDQWHKHKAITNHTTNTKSDIYNILHPIYLVVNIILRNGGFQF